MSIGLCGFSGPIDVDPAVKPQDDGVVIPLLDRGIQESQIKYPDPDASARGDNGNVIKLLDCYRSLRT